LSRKSIRLIPFEKIGEARLTNPVATLGAFDGVHRGHQAVIKTAVDWARDVGGESVIITFDRHPRLVLDHSWPGCITSLEHRIILFEQNGVDCCVLVRFHRETAQMSALDFARGIVLNGLGCTRVVLGFDCRFGRDREGGIETFRQIRDDDGKPVFEVREVPPFTLDGEKISSTAVRAAIAEGRLDEAALFLGRPYSLVGTVIKGSARGKRLGFPTANLNLHHELSPPSGVYETEALILSGGRKGQRFKSLTNIGTRPTFTNSSHPDRNWVETYLMDFEGDLYGQRIEVVFLRRLRDEVKFSGPGELKQAILADIESVRAAKKEKPPSPQRHREHREKER
jgi:riboflavin kinase/FMN adenylyltransferase